MRPMRSMGCWVRGVVSVVAAVAGLVAVAPASAQEARTMPDMHWRMIGPFRGGRTRAVAGVPDQPNVFYIGQVNGGVWKSTDYGRTWTPIFDHEDTQSIGAIAVAPSNDNIIYVASGEGLHRPDLSVGEGAIYRSDDAGKTWSRRDGKDGGLRGGEQIPAIAVDPSNANRLFAAVLGHPYGPNEERGIFRSEDGGKTWKKVLFKGDRIGGSDVVLDPKNPRTVYAALWEDTLGPWEDANQYSGTGGGLFKSTDGGNTWKQLTKGLPEGLSQINVAVAPSDPRRIYATMATKAAGGYATPQGLYVYRSDDGGESWAKITDDPRPEMKIGGGDLAIPVVDPKDADTVYVTSIVTCKSTDGGKTWISLRGAPGGDDYQNMWINPQNPKILALVADQGAVITVNGGESWSSWYNQPTAQLYHVAATDTFPYLVCAGQQESGSVCIASRGNDGYIDYRNWHPAGIIEYGYAAPDPLHPEIIYGAGRTEVSRYNSVTGEVQNVTPLPMRNREFRADRTEPILFSPVDPHTMYYAANHLFKTTDYGHTWQTISPDLSREESGQPASLPELPADQQKQRRGVIYAVAASYKNAQTIWAGTDDGLVWITRDGGGNWSQITPPGLTAWSKIAQIDASRFDDDTAYVAVNRMRIDDLKPYAFRTHDGGKSWQPISAGLPEDAPVDAVRADPAQPGLLYAATEKAVWVSLDDGAHWQSLEYNLPHTSMRDLLVKGDDLIVATHGRSFWILGDVAPLREMAAQTGEKLPELFKPADAWRIRSAVYTDTPMPPDEPMGENPPDGGPIDYNLVSAASDVALEVLGPDGAVLRKYSSKDPITPTAEQMKKNLIPPYWPLVHGPLPASAGMHRWVWDLRSATPTATRYDYPISAVPYRTPLRPQGPLVVAGEYTVRLTVDGHSETQTIMVKMDPRVHTSLADLEALHAAQMTMGQALDAVAKADLAAHAVSEQMNAPQNASLGSQLQTYKDALKLVLEGDRAQHRPGIDEVNGEAGQLYGQLGQSDNPPTEALTQAAAHVQDEVKKVVPAWEEFREKQLPELNKVLEAAHRARINLARPPSDMPEEGDED